MFFILPQPFCINLRIGEYQHVKINRQNIFNEKHERRRTKRLHQNTY